MLSPTFKRKLLIRLCHVRYYGAKTRFRSFTYCLQCNRYYHGRRFEKLVGRSAVVPGTYAMATDFEIDFEAVYFWKDRRKGEDLWDCRLSLWGKERNRVGGMAACLPCLVRAQTHLEYNLNCERPIPARDLVDEAYDFQYVDGNMDADDVPEDVLIAQDIEKAEKRYQRRLKR